MKILVTGGTGFVGSKLCESLVLDGHEISVITRNAKKAQEDLMLPLNYIEGDLSKGTISLDDNYDGVINLVGENIGEKKWNDSQKEIILNSRKVTTENLYDSLKNNKGKFFIQASAIGFYRDSLGDEILHEESTPGDEFLSEVCQAWEDASLVFKNLFEKHTILRIGVVLGHDGALMHKLIPLYRKGLGGVLSHGKQWMSWIHVDDLVSMIQYCFENNVEGIFNAVAPSPVQNESFNKALATYVNRPAWFKVPAFILKLIMGDQSYLALSSQRISSLIGQTGFKFKFPQIEDALRDICVYRNLPPSNELSFHYRYRQTQFIDLPIERVFDFFSEAKNLERITPEYLNFKITYQSTEKINQNTIFKYKLKVHGFPVRWKTNIINWKTNELFTDYQIKGPYKVWYHTHYFYPCKNGTLMVDDVFYKLPLRFLGDFFGIWLVKKDVPDIFKYRAIEMKKYLK